MNRNMTADEGTYVYLQAKARCTMCLHSKEADRELSLSQEWRYG